MIDGNGVFETSEPSLSRYNGCKVLAWTTSHGIRIPLSATRNYRPDFLLAVEDKNGQVQYLLIEIKREDKKENDHDVLLKGKAAEAFCFAYESFCYGILTLKEIRIRSQAA